MKQQFCTGFGASDTHAIKLNDGRDNPHPSAGTPYPTISADEIAAMVANPPSVLKEQGQWFIPSTYHEHDARSHAAQRLNGSYWWLVADIDKGNASLAAVQAAMATAFTGTYHLIYTSRSATEAELKWRILIPLAQPLTGPEYSAYQETFFDALEHCGLQLDRTLARCGQLVYLPNRGEHYQSATGGRVLLDARAHPMSQNARQYMELAQAVESNGTARDEGMRSHLGAFRRKHSISELLQLYGYQQKPGTNHWRSPLSSSGSYSTQDRGDHWISLSHNDAAAGLGKATANGSRYGDAFDLYTYYNCQGNREQAELYAKQCLQEEDAYHIAWGRHIWDGLTHIGGVSKAALMGTTALFQVYRVTGTEETARMEHYIDPWLPKGIVVGVYGRGESGKSSWVSTMVARASAQVSTLWISSEEDLSNIAVRYTKSGGEPNTMFTLPGTPTVAGSDKVEVFNVYEHLERTIQDYTKLTRPDRPLGIVVLDAINALVTWKKGESANDDGSVKRMIAHLHSLSMRYGLTIMIVHHMNKNPKTEYVADAVTGSLSWTSSVRRAFLFYKDMASESDYAFYVRTAKANTGTHFAASYRTEPVHLIHQRADAPGEVLCRIDFTSPIVWGERAISELINDSPEDDPNHKAKSNRKSKEAARIDLIHEAVKAGHNTRKDIIAYAASVGAKLYDYHFTNQCDEALKARGVRIEAQAHNKLLYTV